MKNCNCDIDIYAIDEIYAFDDESGFYAYCPLCNSEILMTNYR